MALLGSSPGEHRPPEARAVALVYDHARTYTRWHWHRTGVSE
jgi:hypothetical protein